jgi:hypothetical protein
VVDRVVVELDLASRAEADAWRLEADPAALAAEAAGALVLADVYAEAAYGPGPDDVAGLTLAALELERSDQEDPVIDDAVVAEALGLLAEELAGHGVEIPAAVLREAVAVRVSARLLVALRPPAGSQAG